MGTLSRKTTLMYLAFETGPDYEALKRWMEVKV